MFPNMLFVVPDVLDEQRVGEHVHVTGYKSQVHVFPNNLVCVVSHIEGSQVVPWGWNEIMTPTPTQEHMYLHPIICSHVVVNVPLSRYPCTRILYPGTKDVPT